MSAHVEENVSCEDGSKSRSTKASEARTSRQRNQIQGMSYAHESSVKPKPFFF